MTEFKQDTRNYLLGLEKEELVNRVMALQKLVFDERQKKNKLRNKPRPIIWEDQVFRKIALKFAYFGGEFDGLQIQSGNTNTIESHLWDAVVKSKLRPPEDMPGPYSRCARTDKGVSAFEQVVTVEVRSKLTEDQILVSQKITIKIFKKYNF